MNIPEEIRSLEAQLIAWRRDFHRLPELGLEETRTAQIAAQTLRTLGYEVHEGIARTGVVGLLRNGDGPTIMVRADMDALPIQEENLTEYVSQRPGVMHACGHDGHVAILLGLATAMAEHRERWQGTLMLVFQPGEEGLNGAEIMIREGILERFKPDRALALHLWNDRPVGIVDATPGPVMAAAETWEATLTGKGGHAAQPAETIDPIIAAAMTVLALQTIVSRNVPATDAAVVTVGMIHAGEAFNVIPDQAQLRGTVRTYRPQVRETVLRRLDEIIQGTAKMLGASVTMKQHPLTPALVNDAETAQVVQKCIVTVLGEGGLNTGLQVMGSEDFAFFLQQVPGCFFFVGSGKPGAPLLQHHNPHFDIDERALTIGAAVMFEALQQLLPRHGA
ncbi:MAG: amidohydrolase [Anaerolineae bacterium]|nr:amidohydrolase [Anaerolineae bacterium]